MFERNRIDNTQELATTSVVIDLDDGRRTSGEFRFPRSRSLLEVLNGPAQFIEFVAFEGDGQPEMVAKSTIRSLRVVSAPSARTAAARLRPAAEFDPYEVLGISPGADRGAIREAFHRLSMRYHPDRYSAADLPVEVVDYLETMARRVNAAYELLSVNARKLEQTATSRNAPIYEKRHAARA